MQRERRSSRSLARGERGQSIFDYSIGVSLFVVVVLGVLLFLPTAFGAFAGQSSGMSDELAAQRGADYLAGTALSAPDKPSTFRLGCTMLLFNAPASESGPSATECGFPTSGPLSQYLNLPIAQPANVTIEANVTGGPEREVLCWDDEPDKNEINWTHSGGQQCGPSHQSGSGLPMDRPFKRGSDPAHQGDFAVAERYGQLNGRKVVLVVRAW